MGRAVTWVHAAAASPCGERFWSRLGTLLGGTPQGYSGAQGTAVPPLYCDAESKWPQWLRVPAEQGSSLNGSPPQAASPVVWQTLPLSRTLVKGREVTRGLETCHGGVISCVGAWGWVWA